MNSLVRPYSGTSSRTKLFRWLIFLFIATVFFLSFHELYMSRRGIEEFNATPDEIVTEVAAGSLSKRIAFLSLGFFAVTGLVCHRGARLRVNGPLGRTILFFVGWSVLSMAWAEDPALTFRRLVLFLMLCVAAADIARRFSMRDIVSLSFFCAILFLFIGVSVEILLGTFRPFTAGYRFAGTLHPNAQGINCALLSLSGFGAADIAKRRRLLLRGSALLGLVFLILTASRTACAAGMLAIAAYLAAVGSRRTKAALALGLVTCCCALALVRGPALIPDLKSAVMFGRDDFTIDAFNARTGIWAEVGSYIQQRPILGYGYGGFWNQRHVSEISDTQHWGVGAGHSVYIDSLLELGLVGLVAYSLVLFGGVLRSFAFYRMSQAPAFAFSGSLLIFCLADGLLESAMLEGTFLMFLSMTALTRLAFLCPPEATEKLMN